MPPKYYKSLRGSYIWIYWMQSLCVCRIHPSWHRHVLTDMNFAPTHNCSVHVRLTLFRPWRIAVRTYGSCTVAVTSDQGTNFWEPALFYSVLWVSFFFYSRMSCRLSSSGSVCYLLIFSLGSLFPETDLVGSPGQ